MASRLRSEGRASPKARSSGYLSMELRPPPSEGKGGEAPQLHRPLSSLDRAANRLVQTLIFQVLRDQGMVDHHSSVTDLLEASSVSEADYGSADWQPEPTKAVC